MAEVTSLREIPGNATGTSVFVDAEKRFVFHNCNEGVYRCRKYKKTASNCRVRAYQQDDGRYFVSGVHNHADEANEIIKLELRAECKRRAADELTCPKQIFEEARRLFPDIGVGFDQAIERAMQRARQLDQPPVPADLDDFERLLNHHQRYKKTLDGKADFYQGRVTCPASGATAFIFVSLALLSLLRDSEEVHCDATFEVVPDQFYQLFTLHITAYGKIYPVAYVFMTHKTSELYKLVIENILSLLRRTAPGNTAVRLMISDYEDAILNNMQLAFPEGRARGCWFHYGQAIYRNGVDLGLKVAYHEKYNVRLIIKMLIALALLPADRMYEGFQAIKQKSAQLLVGETEEDREIRTKIQQLFDYMGYWFTTVGPERISVHGDARRTNNDVEAFHRWLNEQCHHMRQNIWILLYILQCREDSYRRDLNALRNNNRTGRSRPLAQQQRDRKINENASALATNRLTLIQFIEVSAKLFEPSPHRQVDGDQNNPLEIPLVAPEVVLPIPAAAVQRRRGRPPAGERANRGRDQPNGEEPGRRRRGRPPVRGRQAADLGAGAEPVVQPEALVEAVIIVPVPDPLAPAQDALAPAHVDENGLREIEPVEAVPPLGPVRRQRGRRAAGPVEPGLPIQPIVPAAPDRQIEARRSLRPRGLPRTPYDPADFVPVGQNRRRPAARLQNEQPHEQPIQNEQPHEQPIQNEQEIQLRNPCTICYLKEVNRLVAPCGHTFCDLCLANLTNAPRCFICRTNITSFFPLFI